MKKLDPNAKIGDLDALYTVTYDGKKNIKEFALVDEASKAYATQMTGAELQNKLQEQNPKARVDDPNATYIVEFGDDGEIIVGMTKVPPPDLSRVTQMTGEELLNQMKKDDPEAPSWLTKNQLTQTFKVEFNANGKITNYTEVQAGIESFALTGKQIKKMFPDQATKLQNLKDNVIYFGQSKNGVIEDVPTPEAPDKADEELIKTLKEKVLSIIYPEDYKKLGEIPEKVQEFWDGIPDERLEEFLKSPQEMAEMLNLFHSLVTVQAEDAEQGHHYIGSPSDENNISFKENTSLNWQGFHGNISKLIDEIKTKTPEQLEELKTSLAKENKDLDNLIVRYIENQSYLAGLDFGATQSDKIIAGAKVDILTFNTLRQMAKENEYLNELDRRTKLFDNLNRRLLTTLTTTAIQNKTGAGNVEVDSKTVVGGSNDNGEFVYNTRIWNDNTDLWSLLSIISPDEVNTLFRNEITQNGEIFALAQHLAKLPGVFERDMKGLPINKLRGQSQQMSDSAKDIVANELLKSDRPVNEKIQALKILMFKKNDALSMDRTGVVSEEEISNMIMGLLGINRMKEGEGEGRLMNVDAKLTEGADLTTMLNDFEKLFTDDEPLRTGLAYNIDRVITNVFGEAGQIDQLLEWFDGDDALAREMRGSVKNGKEDDGDTIGKWKERITKVTDSKGFKYGQAEAYKIFIGYKMAKYFDPSGRVSDKDLQKTLDAFTGTWLSGRTELMGMLHVAKKLVAKRQDQLEAVNFNFDEMTESDVRHIKAAGKYYKLITDNKREEWDQYKNYEVSITKDVLEVVTGLKDSGGNPVYRVMDSNGINPRFEDLGGLYVVKKNGNYIPVTIDGNLEEPTTEDIVETSRGALQPVIWSKAFTYDGNKGAQLYSRMDTQGNMIGDYMVGYTKNNKQVFVPYDLKKASSVKSDQGDVAL